jgi:hypothetical protein
MTDNPRVILDVKAWQEDDDRGRLPCATMPVSSPIRGHGSSSMNPNASIWALMTDSGHNSPVVQRQLSE